MNQKQLLFLVFRSTIISHFITTCPAVRSIFCAEQWHKRILAAIRAKKDVLFFKRNMKVGTKSGSNKYNSENPLTEKNNIPTFGHYAKQQSKSTSIRLIKKIKNEVQRSYF